MITHISLTTLWVTDQDAAKAFYIDKLGFVEKTDLTMGEGFRWVTVIQPDHHRRHCVVPAGQVLH